MISAIQQDAKAVTLVILDRIATGLDTNLSRLLESDAGTGRVPPRSLF